MKLICKNWLTLDIWINAFSVWKVKKRSNRKLRWKKVYFQKFLSWVFDLLFKLFSVTAVFLQVPGRYWCLQQKLDFYSYGDIPYDTVDSPISGHHRGNNFCPLIGGVRLLESLIFFTFCGLGKGTLKVLSF